MSSSSGEEGGPRLATNRFVEIVVSLGLLGFAALVINENYKLGIAWKEAEGPSPGYFPFYIGIMLAAASAVNLFKALFLGAGKGVTFVGREAFGKILMILLPLVVYVAAVGGINAFGLYVPGIGIYVASTLYIMAYMVFMGGYRIDKAAAVAGATMLVTYWLFEKKFLVPLPKADPPLELADKGFELVVDKVDGYVITPVVNAILYVASKLGLAF